MYIGAFSLVVPHQVPNSSDNAFIHPLAIQTMRSSAIILAIGLLGSTLAQQCPGSWYLEGNDCICMKSTDGSLLKSQTQGCCKSMGYKTYDNVRTQLGIGSSQRGALTRCMADLRSGYGEPPKIQGLLQELEPGECHWPLPLSILLKCVIPLVR